jgi:hypothetical protein
VKRFFALGFCLACSSAPVVSAVHVAPLPVAPAPTVDATLLGECRVEGTGERWAPTLQREVPQFDVFAKHESRAPAFVIAQPGMAHVVWTHFPHLGERNGRARVALGGQKHVRFEGYASLEGRTFSTSKRMFAEPGHLWARAGAPIEMLAAEGDIAIARVETPFVAPKTLTLRGPCDVVAYVPEEPDHATPGERKSIGSAQNRTASFDLFASPSSQPFTTITLEGDHDLMFDVMDRRDGFVRVEAETGDVGFDAWMRAADVDENDVGGIGLGGFGTSGRCGGAFSSLHGVLVRDAQLFVGEATPVTISGAFVEKDAEIRYTSGDERTVDGHVMIAFDFEDYMIRAPEDARMWVAKDAVQSK